MKRPKVLLLNSSLIGCRSTSNMAAQSYSQGINQRKSVRLFLNSDWFSGYRHLEACCVDGPHWTNTLISIFPDIISFVITPESFGEI